MATTRTVGARRLAAAAALLLAASLAGLAAPAEAADPPTLGGVRDYRLTVLHNSDGDSRLIAARGQPDYGGIARFATLVDQLRVEALTRDPEGPVVQRRGMLLLGAGDFFSAGPEFHASLTNGVPFYDAIALDRIGYDAFTIGEDFDFGPDVLADFIESFSQPAPFLSANLDVSAEPRLAALEEQGRIASSVVVREGGRRIGIIGLTTPRLPSLSSPRRVQVLDDLATIVNAEVEAVTAQGANIVILSSHGVGMVLGTLLRELSGVDVVVSGGTDELLANQGSVLVPGDAPYPYFSYPYWGENADGVRVPVLATGGGYKYVGRLVTTFDRAGNLTAVDQERSGPVRVSGVAPDAVEPDPDITQQVVEPVAAAVAGMATSRIGTTEADLSGVESEVSSTETNLGNLVADAHLDRATELAPAFGAPPPDVALLRSYDIRNDAVIPAGAITEQDTFDVLPAAHFVTVVPEMPRQQFKEILEHAVSRVDSIYTNSDFVQVGGFSFTYDPAGVAQWLELGQVVVTPGTRITDVRLDDGTEIVADGAVVEGPALNVVTTDFLARENDYGHPFRDLPFTILGASSQQALEDYLLTDLGGVVTAEAYPEGGEGRITP